MRDTTLKIYFADLSEPKAPAHVTTIRCPRTVKIVIATDEDTVEIDVKDNGVFTTLPI